MIGKGSTALVTGCSSGLGLETVRLLQAQGVNTWGISRREPRLESAAGFRWIACDLTDPEALEPVLETVQREADGIDLLINNAGFGNVGSLPERAEEEIEQSIRVLLLAPMLTTRFFLNGARPAPAVVVNTSSLAAELPIPLMAAYNAAKAGLSAFTRSLILDGSSYPGTRFIDFRPGDYRTPFVDLFREGNHRDDIQAYIRRLEEHHARAPGPERAAADLWRAVVKGREGTVRSGVFFQSVVAPLGVRLLPSSWMRATIRRYYGLQG